MDKAPIRSVFYVSDGTGLTAEVLGHALLAQFPDLAVRQVRLGGVDSFERLYAAVDQVKCAAEADGVPPLVFSTLVHEEWAQALDALDCEFFDLFDLFLGRMENVLGQKSRRMMRDRDDVVAVCDFRARMEAINFALAHDDGVTDARLGEAEVILIGVSRSGKTPTCLYLAMQHAVKAANYPLIPEDFERGRLPRALDAVRDKLYGIAVAPQRLSQVRNQRRPGSRYAALDNCRWELDAARAIMQAEGIPCVDSTALSVEELSAAILKARGIKGCG
ncbi:MAG: kinase/pyrophosphorylase [Rhodocyclaceae bacterium]|nr:kinase/pyrophosphorylase [Rhodocyclaceae bacterium]MBX3666847.1 kinase/pyrophosphorylase [Rhodocyclaceae bacterium]